MPLPARPTKTDLIWVLVTSSKIGSRISGLQSRLKQSALGALCFFCCLPVHSTEYQSREGFLQTVFGDQVPAPQTVWLRGSVRENVETILGHRYPALRIRYWAKQPGAETLRSAWILEEIGKELPITVGLVIDGDVIESVQVLAFRESRGGEVRYPAFTRQFSGLSLLENQLLSGTIDGISGATLSVSALKRLGRLALYLHQQISPRE